MSSSSSSILIRMMRMQRLSHHHRHRGAGRMFRNSDSNIVIGRGKSLIRPRTRSVSSLSSIISGVNNNNHSILMPRSISTTTTNNDDYTVTASSTSSGEEEKQQPEIMSEALEQSELNTSAPPPPDLDVQNFVAKVNNAIHPTSAYDDATVEQVLEESWDLLQTRLQTNNNSTAATSALPLLDSMQQLLDLWFDWHLQHPHVPTQTNRPFAILLEAWSTVSFNNNLHHEAGSKACEVLKRWYELLGGDLALAPTMAEFNHVLAAYAATSTHLLLLEHKEQQSLLTQQVADEAWSVVQELKEWGYTMEPTLETNAHLMRCLSHHIMASTSRRDREATSLYWRRLDQVMTDAVLPVADKYRTRDSKAKIFGDARRTEDPQELLYLLHTCCDALLAAQQFRPYHQQNKDDASSSWWRWGSFLSDHLLHPSDRITALLDYGEEHPLPYASPSSNTSKGLPSVFALMVEGCEAWQCLLHHGGSQQQYHTTNGQPQQQPNTVTAAAHQINAILEHLETLGQQRYSDNVNHNVYYALLKSYLITVKAWEDAISQLQQRDEERESAKLILDQVLERLQKQHYDFIAAQSSDLKRCIASWNTLMSAKFYVGQVDEVHELWKDMRNHNVLGDSTSYSIVLKALADSTYLEAAPKAHKIWQKLIASYHRTRSSNNTFLKLNGSHYASVIVAWSRSTHPEAAHRAMEVFQQLEEDYESELTANNQSSTNMDDNMTTAAAESNNNDNDNSSSLQPTPIHYSALLTTLTRSLGPTINNNDAETIHMIMLNLIDRMLAMPELYQNSATFSVALAALAKIGTQEAALIAQRILDDMEQKWRREHIESFKPNAYSYGKCMLAWSRAAEKGEVKDAYIQVEGLLRRLESDFIESGNDPSLLPNEAVYCALLNAVLASGKVGVAQRAEEVLHDMEEKAAAGLAASPNDFVYSKVIAAYKAGAERDCGEKAQAIVERMAKAYYEEGIIGAKPKAYAYNGAIQSWSRSPRPDKAVHARRLLSEMQDAFEKGDVELKPNRASYVSVLQCCAHTPVDADPVHRQEAVRIALQTVLDVDTNEEKTPEFMYNLALRTACEHTDDQMERKRVVSVLFQKCCDKGLVHPSVLATLRRYYPDFHKKLPGGGQDIKALPTHWTRNLSQKDHR